MDDLRSRRTRAGLSQGELALRSGIAQPNIAAYERGRRRPSASTQARLERALRPRPSDALREHRDEIVRILARHGMTNVRVFGSAATSVDDSESDLDLLVDAADDLDLLDIIDAADEIERLVTVPVDIVTSRALTAGHEIAATAVPV